MQDPELAVRPEERLCGTTVVARQSLELWGVSKSNKPDRSGCVLLQAAPILGVCNQTKMTWGHRFLAAGSGMGKGSGRWY